MSFWLFRTGKRLFSSWSFHTPVWLKQNVSFGVLLYLHTEMKGNVFHNGRFGHFVPGFVIPFPLLTFSTKHVDRFEPWPMLVVSMLRTTDHFVPKSAPKAFRIILVTSHSILFSIWSFCTHFSHFIHSWVISYQSHFGNLLLIFWLYLLVVRTLVI